MRRAALLALPLILLLTACPLYTPESLEFASDPRILRGRYEGAVDTRSSTAVLDLSADGSLLAMGAGDGRSVVQLWDTRTQTPLKELGHLTEGYEWVEAVALTADGSQAVGTRQGQTQVWDVATGRVLSSLHTGNLLKLSGDGTLLATGNWNAPMVAIRSVVTGEKLHVWTGPGETLEDLAISDDGAVVAALFHAAWMPEQEETRFWVRVWSVETGAEVFALEGSRPISSTPPSTDPVMALSADGATVTYITSAGVHVTEVGTGQERATLPLPPGVTDLALSPDGSELAAYHYSARGREGTTLVTVASGTRRALEDVSVLGWSRDGLTLLALAFKTPGEWCGDAEGRFPVPALFRAADLTPLGTFQNGTCLKLTLEAEAEYRAADRYLISGTVQIGDEAPGLFEGVVRGGEVQRYLAPQARPPEPVELTLTMSARPWTLRGFHYDSWNADDPTNTDWTGYVEGIGEGGPPFVAFYLKRVEETP